jgi:hypothetical protein
MSRRISFVAVVVASAFMLGCVTFAVARWLQTNVPIVNCPERSVDFGNVVGGHVLVHRFRIENLGRKPLKILEVRVGCHCTRVDPFGQSWVAPGGSTELTVRFTPERNQGVQRQAVVVRFDDPKCPQLVLRLRAFVLKPETAPSMAPK